MQKLLTIAAILAALVYALVLGVKWLSPKIEGDIANRLTTELAQSGQLWADIQVTGREVTLSGEAPSPEAQSAARSAVARVFGIAKLADLTTLPGQEISGSLIISVTTPVATLSRAEARAKAAAEKNYTLNVVKQGNMLTLEGNVPNETDKALLLRLAELHFPEAKVTTTSLTVLEQGAPAGWRSAAGTVLFNLANLEAAEAKLVGREIMVSGTVLAADFADAAQENIRTAVPTHYRVAFAIETNAPAVEPAVEPVDEPIAKSTLEDAVTEAVSPSAMVAVKEIFNEPVSSTAEIVAAVLQTGQNGDAKMAAIEPSAGGCAALASAEREVLKFAFDSAKIRAADAERISNVATVLRSCQNAKLGGKLEVQGYTDTTGSSTYNQWLSQQRAEAAVRALLRQGAKTEQLRAKGYGQTTQFGPQTTREGRAENRRVMFKAE